MAKYVKYAKMHSTVFAPGLGDLGSSLPCSHKNLAGAEMTYVEGEGVLVRCAGVQALIPLANFQIVILGADAPADGPTKPKLAA